MFSLDFRRLSHYCMSPLCFPMTIIALVSTYYLGSFNQPLNYLSNSIRLPGFSHMVDLMDWFTGKKLQGNIVVIIKLVGGSCKVSLKPIHRKFPLNQSIEIQPPVQVPCLQLWMIQSYPIYVIYVYIIIHIIYIYIHIYLYIYIQIYVYIYMWP